LKEPEARTHVQPAPVINEDHRATAREVTRIMPPKENQLQILDPEKDRDHTALTYLREGGGRKILGKGFWKRLAGWERKGVGK